MRATHQTGSTWLIVTQAHTEKVSAWRFAGLEGGADKRATSGSIVNAIRGQVQDVRAVQRRSGSSRVFWVNRIAATKHSVYHAARVGGVFAAAQAQRRLF